MCLDRITRLYDPPFEKEEVAYKGFLKCIDRSGKFELFALYRGNKTKPYPLGVWLDSKNFEDLPSPWLSLSKWVPFFQEEERRKRKDGSI